ncbi:MAG: glycosyltransferase family 39 protein [Blastocatellia bacterium]|nr:glycosyltransferase family 39 protein [Blastocatellia bacterium]
MNFDKRTINIMLAVLAVSFILLRFWRIDVACLWFDEIFSVHAAQQSWGNLFSFIAADLIHPPLFYVVLKLWIGIGGESVLWLRTLPALFAILSIPPLIWLTRVLKLPTLVAPLACLLLAFNGSVLKYSQEVRMYSMLMCLSLFSAWLFARYYVKGKSFIPLLIINCFVIYTHYFGWFVVGSEIAAILLFQRMKWRRMAVMFGILAAVFTPWAIAVISAAESGGVAQNIGWMQRPGIRQIVTLVFNLIEPIYYQSSSIDPISDVKVALPILLIIALSVIAFIADNKARTEAQKDAVRLLFVFVVVPMLIAFLLSWIMPVSIWGTRHLIILFAPFALIAAFAVLSLPKSWMQTASVTLIVLFCGYGLVNGLTTPPAATPWCEWNSAATKFAEQGANTERLYVFEDLAAYHAWFTLKDSDPAVIKVNGTDVKEDKAYFLPRRFDRVNVVNIDEINEPSIFVAFRTSRFETTASPLLELSKLGYRVETMEPFSAEPTRTYLVKLSKN